MRFLLTMDRDLLDWMQTTRSSTLDAIMKVVTDLGDRYVLTAVAALVVLFLVLRRRPREAVAVALAGLMSLGLTEGVKALVGRERPLVRQPVLQRPTSASFPSGHALSSAAIYGVLALIAARRMPRPWQKVLIVGSAVLLAALIGFSRMYLMVHYGTDVAAGLAAGWGCALLCAWWAGLTDQQSEGGSANGAQMPDAATHG